MARVMSAREKLGIKDHWLEADGVGMEIHGDAGVASVAREITATYHLDRIEFSPGDIAVDVGAYVGVVSIYLAKKWPGIRIIAVEPVPENVARLQFNVDANGVADWVTIVNKAITGDGKPITLWGQAGGNLVLSEFNRVQEIRRVAESITLPELFKVYNVEQCKLLKMDCEGSEHEILFAHDDILDRVEYLSIEIHHVGGHNSQTLADLCRCHIPEDKLAIQYAGFVGEEYQGNMGRVMSAAEKLANQAAWEAEQAEQAKRPPGWVKKKTAEPCDGCDDKKKKKSEVDK